ncbi:hypothetical protein GH714_040645 [Hevea brasiliensis]|uniref:VASt domain-containing protein n=1 Tax=Hevea brasiliensis TaxID=3981 RepID=A0A6A6KW76_HEVBR|nr:hypothetical protein GH714_040645 [Hevea brasiliensis]
MYCSKAPCLKMAEGKKLMKTIANCLERAFYKNEEASRIGNSSDSASASSDYEDCVEEYSCSCSFGEAMEIMKSRDNKQEMPENLHGVFLLDQIYEVTSYDLKRFLFAPDSQFRKDLAELQDTTDVEEESWTWKSVNMSHLARTVTYTKAATKLVKAVKATEEQTYLRADGRQFAVLVNVSTPDVPYGSTFNVELLYKIMPGPEPSSGEESSRLIISWGIDFHQCTLMKGSDHGIKAQGNGWILTVALIEGTNLASLDSTGFSDPYVVFTCNVLLVKLFWNYNAHVLEFDAMEEPPSVLDVEVFDFDGPFDQATSLEHAEINFLKCTSTELADMWISLEGKLAQSSQSKLHLRIFLDNNKGVETIKEYLTKMEKEVGAGDSLGCFNRTIMALWRTRTLTAEQKAQIAEEQQEDQEETPVILADSGSLLDVEEAKMSKVYSAEMPISVNFKYQIEQSALAHSACKCDVYVGTTWLKGTKFQQRITGNITEKFTHRLNI